MCCSSCEIDIFSDELQFYEFESKGFNFEFVGQWEENDMQAEDDKPPFIKKKNCIIVCILRVENICSPQLDGIRLRVHVMS